MTAAHLNLLSALLSFATAVLWAMLGDVFSGLIWLGASAVWLVLAVLTAGYGKTEASPGSRLAHRFSRLLRWL